VAVTRELSNLDLRALGFRIFAHVRLRSTGRTVAGEELSRPNHEIDSELQNPYYAFSMPKLGAT
jgi:hypothetical protein